MLLWGSILYQVNLLYLDIHLLFIEVYLHTLSQKLQKMSKCLPFELFTYLVSDTPTKEEKRTKDVISNTPTLYGAKKVTSKSQEQNCNSNRKKGKNQKERKHNEEHTFSLDSLCVCLSLIVMQR